MPVSYGSNDDFADTRTAVVACLNGLKTAMTSGSVVPAIATVMSKPTEDPGPTLNAVAVSLQNVITSPEGVNYGPIVQSQFTVDIRVYIGEANAEIDEDVFWNLANSIINYFYERKSFDISGDYSTADADVFEIMGDATAELTGSFDDVRKVGGTVTFIIRSTQTHTHA